MRNDYFAALRVPTVPTTPPQCGDSANPHKHCVSPPSPQYPQENTDTVRGGPLADPAAPCEHCGCGSFWRAADGWRCESCNPAPDNVTRWRNVSGGRVAPMPPPALPWPADLTEALKRVATAFEWTRQDIADFCRWARRSQEALADAGEFLRAECAKLTGHQP
ncbi:MAG: hypothetical protein AB7I42_28920 [Bradyrhizobium sp.]|uniref:hypothetical protein n=1 Tax=Pseudomonadota TaxID=1224 RepID=UPI003D101857